MPHLSIIFYVPSTSKVATGMEIDPNGRIQLWHTQNVLRRMLKYMPMETGMFSKQAVVSSGHEINIVAAQANYLYYGNRMVNARTGKGPRWIPNVGWRWPKGATLVPTSQPLNYTKTFHPLAGPYWDQRLQQAEGDIIARETENYLRMTGGDVHGR